MLIHRKSFGARSKDESRRPQNLPVVFENKWAHRVAVIARGRNPLTLSPSWHDSCKKFQHRQRRNLRQENLNRVLLRLR